MQRNTQFIFGGIIIGLGLITLISAFLDVSAWAICIPSVLILLGIWILVRPSVTPDGSDFKLRIFGDIKKRGSWNATGEEILMFIGDVRLDFTNADIAPGETKYRIIAFIGDIRLKIPQDVGVSVSSMAFINEMKIMGQKNTNFLVPVDYKSEGFEGQERKIRIETVCFIGEIRIDDAPVKTPADQAG